jgi:hypothetical protein
MSIRGWGPAALGGAVGGAALAAAAALALGGALGGGAAAQEKEPPAEVMKRMKFYNEALGVDCDYCHVPNKFEIDTPRRKTAKWMQQQMVDALVTKDGNRSIDCRTCHDGRARFLPSSQ